MKAARTKLRMKSGIGSESTNPIVMVVPTNGNVRSKAERAKLVYLWVGDDKQCFAPQKRAARSDERSSGQPARRRAVVEGGVGMTTDIRDGVEWKPWWVRYAEFDGKQISLNDWSLGTPAGATGYWARYHVCVKAHHAPLGCGTQPYTGDSLDEATAAFYAAEEKLLRGELA